MAKVAVIGSGFSGLSAACYAAHAGHEVNVFEKNDEIGGRARVFRDQGFVFDMGPSWYWMPDVFERFFNDFGKTSADYYELKQLDPAFQMFFKDAEPLVVPSNLNHLYDLFESIEKGSAQRLKQFLAEGELKYKVAMEELIYRPSLSWFEFARPNVISGAIKSNILSSMSAYIRGFFKDPRLIALMEFPVIFLGAMPDKIPALYSLMNYSAFSQGTWYPQGGMFKIIEAMKELASSLHVKFNTAAPVQQIIAAGNKTLGLNVKGATYASDAVIASADYHHVEQNLLKTEERNYSPAYWKKKTMAPSCLIFYIGVNKKLKNLIHHNLFFDSDFNKHASQIYQKPAWPDDPLFYVCCPSKTDDTVAPEGHENVFILIPLAAGLEDSIAEQEIVFEKVMRRLEAVCGEKVQQHIVYKRNYCVNDFVNDYNAFRGNAYGLANTLRQTAVFKPSVRNKNLNNLFYTGQLTVPGPGVPPAIISGKIAAAQAGAYLRSVNKTIKKEKV